MKSSPPTSRGTTDSSSETPETPHPQTPPTSAKSIFLDRNVVMLWFGQMISRLGDWCLWIAIPTTIYNSTNSRVDLAFTIVTEAIPFLIFSPIAGAIVDRFDRRKVMIFADIGRAGMVAILIVPHGAIPLWIYYAVLFGCSALSAFFGPARIAIMTQLIPMRQMVRVNAALATGMQISEMAGPALGGLVLAWMLQRGSFIIDVVSFLVSAGFIYSLRLRNAPSIRSQAITVRTAVEDMRTGLRVLLTTPIPRGMLVWWNLGYFATSIFIAMMYPVARDVLHTDIRHFGIMMSCIGAGLLCAGVAVATVLHPIRPDKLILTGLVLSVASCAVITFMTSLTQCYVSLFMFGFGGLLVNVTAQTLVQTVVPREMLGRYFGMFAFLGRLCQLLGTALAGVLATAVSLHATYGFATALYAASAFFAYYLVSIPRENAARPTIANE